MADPIAIEQAENNLEQPYDTGDREQVNKARKKSARTRSDRLHFVAAAMQHPEGRAWFYDFLLFTKVFNTPFREDPYSTAFNCGQQTIGFALLDDIQTAAPEKYLTMVTENKKKDKNL